MFRRLLAVLALLGACAVAQTSPFLPQELYDKLNNELSGDRAYDSLRELTKYHVPNGAGRDFYAAAAWIEAQAKAAGLEDVKLHRLPYDGQAWTPLSGDLWLIEMGVDGTAMHPPRATRLISYPEIGVAIADNSRPVQAEAELVDVGAGTSDKDYEGKDVKGKIVLASGHPRAVETEAVWKRGALGIVSYYSSRVNPSDYPDQVAWASIHSEPDKEGHQPSFAMMISWRQGAALHQRLQPRRIADAATESGFRLAPADALRVRVSIESVLDPNPTQGVLEGWIRSSKNHDQQVVLTAHIQEERTSANDDRGGCANLLEIARALVKLINEGKLPRPERDIRFWWVNEIDGPYAYFAAHPEERAKVFVNINQDMVGAHQTVGGLSRVQHVTRTPWSRPTFFNDVVESVVMSIYYGNNAYLAPRSGGNLAPGSQYTRPIYSHLGSRDRWAAEIVPFFTQSDHMVFNDGQIAATHGGVTFTNWPDEHIHSTDDDMWQMDPTQFKRSALAVSALAWFMANASGDDSIRTILTVSLPAAASRIEHDIQNVGLAQLAGQADPADWLMARKAAFERELRAIDSLRSLVAGNSREREVSLNRISGALKTLESFRSNDLTVSVPSYGKASIAYQWWSVSALQRIPVPIPNLADYLKKREDLKRVPGLHSYMRYEALNFMDGKRSVWDIYAATRAESLAAGEWYYGKVTPEMIQQLFDNAATAGMITWKEAAPAKPGKKKKP